MSNCKLLTINEMEDALYDFINGVLPLVSESGIYITRFLGFSLQKDDINSLNRNVCLIKAGAFKSLYTNVSYKPTEIYNECLFKYTIVLQNKQTNALLTDVMQQALRICTHREGYDFFSSCGLKHITPTTFYVKTDRNISVFTAEIDLEFTAAIKMQDIAYNRDVASTSVTIRNYDNDVITIS